jgi:hypothetical protein
VPAQHGGDVGIELSILTVQRKHRHADDWEDETQAVNVLGQVERKRVMLGWVEVVEFGRRGRPPFDDEVNGT